jgi:hypothetical protein
MIRFVRNAVLPTACVVVIVGVALAGERTGYDVQGFPVNNSTLGIVLVSDFMPVRSPVIPGPMMTCIRDADNHPVPFATVTVDFSTCGTMVEMAANQEDPAVAVNCGLEMITKATDASGCIILGPYLARTGIDVQGWPTNPGTTPMRNIGPSEPELCAAVYGNGFLLGTAYVFINRYDSDRDGDVDAGDMGYTLDAIGHFLSGPPPNPPYRTFYDYDWDGDVDAGDAAVVLDAMGLYFQGHRAPYQGAYCP